jgi:hypothetical protein
MIKKKALIIAGILVVVVAVGVVLYLVIKNDATKNNNNPAASYGSEFVSVDKNGNLGTDKVVTKEQVSEAIAANGDNISGPELSAVLTLGNVKSQTATYTFKMSNGKEAEVNVDARTYPSIEDMGDLPFRQTEKTPVEGVGDKARFLIRENLQLLGSNETLMATKGKTSFAIALSQKRDEVAIDKATARDIILKVAKAAKFDEVK